MSAKGFGLRKSALLVPFAIGAFALLAIVALTASKPVGAAVANVNVGNGSGGNVYVPASVTVAVGDTVTWTWASGFHNVDAVDGSFDSGAPHATPGSPFSNTFNTAGTFFYYCEVHATAADATDAGIAAGKMVGKVVVQAQGTGTATATATTTATATATTPATATATATRTATPVATATATVVATPSAPKTGQAGLLDSSGGGAGTVVLWLGLAIVVTVGGRRLSQRIR